MIRRVLVAVALVATALTGVLTEPIGADAVSVQFWAAGPVTNDAAPIPPTPLEGETAGFVIQVDSASASAQGYVSPYPGGELTIYVTPATNYYKQNDSGVYRPSSYEATVVEGQAVRVSGRRVTRGDTTRFIATRVANPPDPPPSGGGGGQVPKCGASLETRFTPFAVAATIVRNRVHFPCSTGVMAGGIMLEHFTDPLTYSVSRAVEEYGGRLDIYINPAPPEAGGTRYIKDGRVSTYQEVVRIGNAVRVFGRFVEAADGWLFVAKSIWTGTSGDSSGARPLNTYIEAARSDPVNPNFYTGISNGPNLDGWTFQSEIGWHPNGADWTATGTWSLTSPDARDVLRGTLSGETDGTALDLGFEITSGEGTFFEHTGGGDFTGDTGPTAALGVPPSAFTGQLRLVAVLCEDCGPTDSSAAS